MIGITRFQCNAISGTVVMLLAGIFAGSMFVSPLRAQATGSAGKSVAVSASKRFQPDRFAGRAGMYYKLIWGVDSLSVKAVESGELIRFSYEVLDPEKAKVLNNRDVEPALVAPVAHLILKVPELEKVGKLRQSNSPEAGRSYWMAFSNPRRAVKRGDRVNVVIGQFHADGLVVE
jgi:hypothetical protein